MNTQIVVVSASPAQVKRLAPTHGPSRQLAQAARVTLGHALSDNFGPEPSQVTIVGSRDERWGTAHTGAFTAWGDSQTTVGAGQYLPELVARYLLCAADPTQQRWEVIASRSSLAANDIETGTSAPQLIVLAADGSAGLGSKAPLASVEGAEDTHAWCQDVLAGKPAVARSAAELEKAGVLEPQLWLELLQVNQLFDIDAQLAFADDSLGVGRYVARWELL